jgi:hypothetical protein
MTIQTQRASVVRADLLFQVRDLPEDAFVSARHAAAVLDTSISVLANWRSQRRGPSYCGNHGFIRYRLSALHAWMSQRRGEVMMTGEL